MKKIIVINGPNLNLLGVREVGIYGNESFEHFFSTLKNNFPNLALEYFQSNIEGELIDKIQEVGFTLDGIVLNAGAYTHTSIAISDALAAIKTPVIEVHISNIYKREEYRHVSLTAKNCIGLITGFGMQSYQLALNYLDSINK
jgi:3-dehydroquinate dehydratase II